MHFSGISNLASTIGLNSRNAKIRLELNITGKELATGMASDLLRATSGNMARLYSLNHALDKQKADQNSIGLGLAKANTSQIALSNIHNVVDGFGQELLSAIGRSDQYSTELIGRDAADKLEQVITSLNVQVGQHSLFSGAALEKPAIAPVEVLLADISALVLSSADASAAIASIDDYFYTPGGGYESNIYLGSVQGAPPISISNGEVIEYAVKGNSKELRDVLRGLSIAAVAVTAPNFSGTQELEVLLTTAASSSINAVEGVTRLKATMGSHEFSLSASQAFSQSLHGALEIEKSAMLTIDPYEVATKFEALQIQLETLYTITARLSGLTLTNFLR